MKSRAKLLVFICIFVILTSFFIVLYLNKRNFRIETKDIARITVQYKLNKVVIGNPQDLHMFYDNIIKDYKLHSLALGSKGWIYWVKCYDSDGKLIYDFTIQSDKLIKINGWFYEASDGVINLNYFRDLFTK